MKAYMSIIYITSFLFISCISLTFAEENLSSEEDSVIMETVNLIRHGSFEKSDDGNISPLSEWKCSPETPENKISLDNEVFLSGKSSLRVDGTGKVTVSTNNIPLPTGTISIAGSISYRGEFDSKVSLMWLKGNETIGTKELRLIETPTSDWKRFVLSEAFVPQDTTAIQIQLSMDFPASGTVWWDEGNFTGVIEQQKTVDILVNQVGYDLLCPKVCVIATNFKPEKITGYLLNSDDQEVKEISFGEPSRIIGAYQSDWGKWFYRGDFSDYNEEGTYRIVIILGEKRYYSPSFAIGKEILWEKTIPIVLEGIRLHRCGAKIEGIHEPCHTDDALNGVFLKGGWHDGETYSKTKSAICLSYLAESYNICMWRLLKNNELASKMREEIEWGANYISNRIKEDGTLIRNVISPTMDTIKKPEEETDNIPDSGDERPIEERVTDEDWIVFGLGNTAYMFSKINPQTLYIPRAELLAKSLSAQEKRSPGLFTALVYLEEIKNDGSYISLLQSCIPENLISVSETIPRYDALTYEQKTFDLAQSLKNMVQKYAEQANQNPFGICPMKWTPEIDFFGVTTQTGSNLKGNNPYLLQIAQIAGKAFRFIPEDTTKKLFFDHINWILGLNPYGICFIHGLGTKNLSNYAHPYVKSGIDLQKLIGVIPYGIRPTSSKSDTPYLDISSSTDSDIYSLGISIDTIALYINALSHFYRVRIHPETNPIPKITNE